MGRGWPGIRRGTRLYQSSQSAHKQRPTVLESQELCGCGVPVCRCVGRARLTKYRSACAGSGKNSVTGLIACHFTTRMRRRGRPRVCTNLFLFFRYVGPARAATAGPARSGSADAARGPTSYAGGAATWQGRRHPVTPPSPPQPRGPRPPAAAAAADPPPAPAPPRRRCPAAAPPPPPPLLPGPPPQ